MRKTFKLFVLIVLSIGIALLAILIALSYKILEPNEVGLDYDGNNHRVNVNILYKEGRHYIGIGHSFKIFPYVQVISRCEMREIKMDRQDHFSARTKDGLSVNITCAFQYQLVVSLENILELYYKWGAEKYEEAFRRMAKGALREAVAEFTGMYTVTGRTAVEEAMSNKLAAVLESSQATLRNFQLFEIVLPEEFMKAMYDLEKYKQEYTSVEYHLESAKVYAEGAISKADEESSTITSEAEAYSKRMNYVSSEYDGQEKEEIVELTKAISDKNIETVKELMNTLRYTESDLLPYLFSHSANLTKLKLIKLTQENEMLSF